MQTQRIHRTTSADGTEIAALVAGEGPPIVLVHGAFGGGDTTWTTLLPLLTERFTCHAMSLRGRVPSGPSDDLSRDRLVDDVIAMAESIGEPVGLLGLSSGALLSLGAAERSTAPAVIAAYEPPTVELLVGDLGETFQQVVERVIQTAEDGRPAEAAEIFVRAVTNDAEFRSITEQGLIDAIVPNVDTQVREFPQVLGAPPPGPTDPGELARITAPVVLLQGTQSEPGTWFPDGIRHCAEHIPNARVVTIDGAGHLGPIVEPDAVAPVVIDAFSDVLGR